MMARFLPSAFLAKAAALCLGVTASAAAQRRDTIRVDYPASKCAGCAEWMLPQAPFRIFGNTYYVGTHGIASILITSDAGDVLIDGALPAAAPLIEANIRALGVRLGDVKLILNSHAHYDHAGGIAALQRATGARVAASPWSARTIERGASDAQDPQFGIANPYPPARDVHVLHDGDTLRVGPLALVAHATPGHTPGGTSWTWRSCDGGRCLDLLYADSQSPASADNFSFTRNTTYPTALADFARGFATLERLPCDILLTPHPEASRFFARVAARDAGRDSALVDPALCKEFVAAARQGVADRVAREGKPPI